MSNITSAAARFVHDNIDRSIRDGVDVSSPDDCTTETVAEDRGNTSRVKLGYEPVPKEREFHASRAKYRLFGANREQSTGSFC